MKVKSYAKINLTLDVLKKEKGYHKILTIFQQISLHDVLTFKKVSKKNNDNNLGITLTCGNPEVPRNEDNTVIKAAKLLLQNIPLKKQKSLSSIHIHIQKNIPLRSGLGGGSSNAAVTLLTLNKLWHLNLSLKKLGRLAAQIGKDVPFFLQGGTALGSNFGEKITPLPSLPQIPLIITINNFKTSTKEQYSALDLKKCGKGKSSTMRLVKSLQHANVSKKNAQQKTFQSPTTSTSSAKLMSTLSLLALLKHTLHNDFEAAIVPAKWPQVQKLSLLSGKLKNKGAISTIMAGSGPSLIAFFASRKARDSAYHQLPKNTQIKSATLASK
jgi:4-diphosphocytidyl-2-C-methyl-D-erythritol kinase